MRRAVLCVNCGHIALTAVRRPRCSQCRHESFVDIPPAELMDVKRRLRGG